MKKYIVSGTTEVTVTTAVYAKNGKEALDKAAMEFKGISSFVGNGGTDKLIGVNGEDDTISSDVNVEFDDCWEDE